MQFNYEGTDITGDVDIAECIHHDESVGKCDFVEIEMENAGTWFRWKPQCDDRIEIQMDGYTTGTLYLNAILPKSGRYRIIATSIPRAAQRCAYKSYAGMRIEDIMESCAAECGMQSALFGIDGNIRYPYIQRRFEGAAAFLTRILKYEGAVLKSINATFTAIGIEYAQKMDATQQIEMKNDQDGVDYFRRDIGKLSSVEIRTPFADGTAHDLGAQFGQPVIYSDAYPATDNAQALRWARGLILHHNRDCEELNMRTQFNAGFTAMARIDIQSQGDMDGNWIIDNAVHDFVNRKSAVRLLRCIDTIQ